MVVAVVGGRWGEGKLCWGMEKSTEKCNPTTRSEKQKATQGRESKGEKKSTNKEERQRRESKKKESKESGTRHAPAAAKKKRKKKKQRRTAEEEEQEERDQPIDPFFFSFWVVLGCVVVPQQPNQTTRARNFVVCWRLFSASFAFLFFWLGLFVCFFAWQGSMQNRVCCAATRIGQSKMAKDEWQCRKTSNVIANNHMEDRYDLSAWTLEHLH